MALITPNDGIGYDPTSYDGDLIESNRSIILSATKDSLDQPPAEVAEGEDTVDETTMSIASTVDVDNTSCYLRRFAVKFALEKRKHEEVETIFVKINKYKMDQDVIYTGHGSHDRARIVDVYYEDNNKPRYNIELCDGYIEAHVGEDQLKRLDKTKDYGIDENTSRAPPIPTLRQHKDYATSKVVNFESNPTLLFSSLYNGDYEAAKDRLASHPEEASIWVVRYSTHSNQQNADHEHCSTHQSIRWKILPLHLFIILAGSHDYNHLDSDEALMLGAAAPPLELLTALISAYPHATKCIDDQHMIPLYASIRGHSSPRIIQALINASPESVSWKDVKGRDAFVLLDQVFKRLMKQAVVNAEAGDETHDALKIREWKQEVLNLLNDVTMRNTPTEITNPFDEKVNSPRQIHRLQMNNLFDAEQALNEMEPNIICKEQGNSDYLQLQFTGDESTVTKDITPCSTMTSTTEVTTPTSVDNKKESSKAPEAVASMNWEARCQMLELESYDSEDRADTLLPSDRAVTTLEGADSSSIFRAREAQHEEAVRRSNVVTDCSGSNISQYSAENTENVSKGADVSVFDSSTILAAIFSYESEDEGHPNAVCPSAFAKEAMPPMSGRMSNLP